MKWFLVFYFVNGVRHDFACVHAWTRREAYHEVCHALHEAAAVTNGPGVSVLWDTEDNIHMATDGSTLGD